MFTNSAKNQSQSINKSCNEKWGKKNYTDDKKAVLQNSRLKVRCDGIQKMWQNVEEQRWIKTYKSYLYN